MARIYKEYLKLFEIWPIDITKGAERDYGEYLRYFAKEQCASNKKLSADEELTNSKYLASLKRLATNQYAKKYPRIYTSSATGLNAEECKSLMSQECLDFLAEESKGVFKKLFSATKKKK